MMMSLVLPCRPFRRLPLPAMLLLLFAMPALAQQLSQAQVAAIRQACRADYQAYCASVPTGGAAAFNCLKQNVANLSASCQHAVGAASGGAAASSTANAPATAAPPAQPAPAAPTAAPAMSPRQEAMLLRQACGFDFRRYCSGVPFGGGRVLACLQGNADRLSPRCGSALQAMRQSQ
jgi:Cysteine rich repeat